MVKMEKKLLVGIHKKPFFLRTLCQTLSEYHHKNRASHSWSGCNSIIHYTLQYPVFVNLTGEGFIQKIAKVVAAVCLIQPISTAYLIQKTARCICSNRDSSGFIRWSLYFWDSACTKTWFNKRDIVQCTTVAITHFYKQIQTSLLYE